MAEGVSLGLPLRALTAEQRLKAFTNAAARRKLAVFVSTIREMEGGVAYGIACQEGMTPRAMKIMLAKAARALDLRVKFAKSKPDDKEVIVELEDG